MWRGADIWRFRNSAFTLIEVLAALMFLAILLPVVIGGLSLSNRVSVFAERKEVAADLAENKLNGQLIGNAWQTASNSSGDFGPDYPGYRWEMTQESWQGDTVNLMTQLTMEVFYKVQGEEHSVRLATLVSANTGTQIQTGTQSAP